MSPDQIVAIKKPGSIPGRAVFRTEPPVTDEVVKELLQQLRGHPTIGQKWTNEHGLLSGDVSDFRVPDRQFVEILGSSLAIAARTVDNRRQRQANEIADYLTGLSGNTGLPLED